MFTNVFFTIARLITFFFYYLFVIFILASEWTKNRKIIAQSLQNFQEIEVVIDATNVQEHAKC